MRVRLPEPTYANVTSTVALFIALGGVSWAAATLPRNSVGPTQLRAGAVTEAKLSQVVRGKLAKAGQVGATGATGSQGPKGEQGAQGERGLQGEKGVQGERGAAGSDASLSSVAAGGDLTGNYPSPQIAANAVGSAEVAANALTGSDVDENTLRLPFGIGFMSPGTAGTVALPGLPGSLTVSCDDPAPIDGNVGLTVGWSNTSTGVQDVVGVTSSEGSAPATSGTAVGAGSTLSFVFPTSSSANFGRALDLKVLSTTTGEVIDISFGALTDAQGAGSCAFWARISR